MQSISLHQQYQIDIYSALQQVNIYIVVIEIS